MSEGNPSGYLLKLAAATAALAVVAVLELMSAVSINHAHAIAAKPIRWLLNGPGVTVIAQDAEVSRVFDNAQPFILRRDFAAAPPSWNAIPIASFANITTIRDALQMRRLGPEVRGVMYDYERWQFTPEEEQRNSAGYVKHAADLVHAQGLLFLTAPAVNLVTVMAPGQDRNRLPGEYLRLGIAADAARYADVFDIQAQRFEPNTELYSDFVRQAAAQARQANPKVMVLAGISTRPIGKKVTADDILRAIAATRDVVDGYWFNIPQPSEYTPRAIEFRPDIAIDVLRRLARQ